jgi:4-hydroxybenzoate polyprenyltransferase
VVIARVVVGIAAGALALLAWLAFGFAALLVLVGLAYLLNRVSERRQVLVGAALGVAGVLVWVAYDNRAGPGTTCAQTPHGVECAGHLNPTPWLVAGVVFATVAGGLAAYSIRKH